MHVTSIIENTTLTDLPVEHGLSLHLHLEDGRAVLFDMGQSSLFADNAERLACPIADVDLAVVSHGHYDHGGGLRRFLELNSKAKVYIHKDAFRPHYSLKNNGLRYIGLDTTLADNMQIVRCDDFCKIDPSMTLFADVPGYTCNPVGNRLLFGPSRDANDDFSHEQNLLITEGTNTILFAGCAHRGIVNIMRKATCILGNHPTHVFAGMHLTKSGMNEDEENAFIAQLANQLSRYTSTTFYTMHCTGTEQYHKLKAIMGEQIHYLSCGMDVEIYGK